MIIEIQSHHGRITLQGFGPNTIYVKLQNFGSSYNLPKTKDKTLVYLSKKPKFGGVGILQFEVSEFEFYPAKSLEVFAKFQEVKFKF